MMGRRRLLMLAPLGVVAAGGAAFWTMLSRMEQGRFDPHDIGNPMLGKPMPDFTLPPVAASLGGGQGFSAADLRAASAKQPVLINFFASWCIPCAEEAEALTAIAGQGVVLWGIAYEDKPDKTAAFLDKYGNPYARLAADRTGRTFIDFGLFGVPESFIIDASGRISWHIAGPLTGPVVENQLGPALQKARA